ncbi:MAG TPA: formate--phosphoribosylaminoimidazolecarboxamide ligase family protein [Nitrososphaeraceae archaeon]|nr:formate--phosphoribosylaminoimidazolecarboxamide ligase family protein [Nitrososphaeraceae archaeon]
MIDTDTISRIVNKYDAKNIHLAVIGSHSALEIMDGAKDEGLRTVCICQKGRELPYLRFKRLADEIILVDKFSDLVFRANQNKLREINSILVPHRAFTAYVGYDSIENELMLPILGNRKLFRAEERNYQKNQYYLLERAQIAHPKIYKDYSEINGLAIVKIQESTRKLERAFFVVSSAKDYLEKSKDKVRKKVITNEDLKSSVIEEFVVGTYFNFNFFSSPLTPETEFLGIERRLQTNLNDLNSLPAKQQLEFDTEVKHIEIGHTPASIRESMLEKVFELGDKFADAVRNEYPPGIIGPFSLQGIVRPELDIVVYDVSLRVPGNPIMATTSPYTKYSYGQTFGIGRRVAMEVKKGLASNKLFTIVT